MIIFVGDKPSPKMKPGAKPFEGAACEARLKAWIKELGITEHLVFNSHSTADWWNALDAIDYHRTALIVALGNNASKRLNEECLDHFKLPHPSGRNRQINDKAFIEKKLQECREWLKSYGE